MEYSLESSVVKQPVSAINGAHINQTEIEITMHNLWNDYFAEIVRAFVNHNANATSQTKIKKKQKSNRAIVTQPFMHYAT